MAVNQATFAYDDFGRPQVESQAHAGTVAAGTQVTQRALRVQYDLARSYQAFTKMLARWTAVLIAA